MKNKIIYILIAIIIMLMVIIFATNRYDVNRDGKVNSKDLLELRKYLINKGE